MTGRSNSAATSRMMWMLSASSARRWSSCGGAVLTVGSKVDVCIRQLKKKARTFSPGLSILPLFAGNLGVRNLRERPDRERGDPEGPTTTTCARPANDEHHRRDVYHLGAAKS